MRRLIDTLGDPGTPSWAALVLRVVLAAVFIPVGLGKFFNHGAYTERFERWGFEFAPGAVAIVVGAAEVLGGLMLLLGILPRLAALVLLFNMVGALVTAGRIDGGQDIWLPIILIVALAAMVRWGSRRWAVGA